MYIVRCTLMHVYILLLSAHTTVLIAFSPPLLVHQMTELWTQFGNLTEIWLDGGAGPIGPRVSDLLNRTLARNAVAFNGG